jgi:hypothetical protein
VSDVGGPTGTAASDPEISALEARYRRLLRLLPRDYRAAREEEMVDTYLAAMYDADPENFDLALKHGRPSGTEMRAVAALALRARWGETVAPERFAARAAGLRTAMLMALTVLWTTAVVTICWWAWSLAFPEVDRDAGTGFDPWSALFGLPVGSWAWIQQWSLVAWLPTLPLVVFGGRIGARWAAACTALPVSVSVANAVRLMPDVGPVWPGYLVPVLIDIAVFGGLVALGVVTVRGPAHRPVRYFVAACSAVGVFTVIDALVNLGGVIEPDGSATLWNLPATLFFTDLPAQWCWAAVVAALWLAARRVRLGTVRASTLLALSVFAGVATLYRFAASVDTLPRLDVGLGPMWTAAIVTQFVLAGVICVLSGVMAARRLHRLPAPGHMPSVR